MIKTYFLPLFCFLITSLSIRSQNQLQIGNNCFEQGDYSCAARNFEVAFNASSVSDKKLIELKLIRSKWCAEHIIIADNAFSNKRYAIAMEEYLTILESNPKDNYAISQIEKCNDLLNPPKLRQATQEELTDIWNNKYGVKPQRRQNLINAGIDPDDAQVRINAGEGKPPENNTIKLSVSKTNITFPYKGKESEPIIVNTDKSSFEVPLVFVPYWCTVKTYNGYFTIIASANTDYSSRKDWLKVTAGNEEIKVYVEQLGNLENKVSKPSYTESKKKEEKPVKYDESSFNHPNTHDHWGLNLGFKPKIYATNVECLIIGLKYEPLFKYGFGLNTGINFEGYSSVIFDEKIFLNGFSMYAMHIPFHLEYRLNFSRGFNIFAYGGGGYNTICNSLFKNYSSQLTIESGAGLRIKHLQFAIGKSSSLAELTINQNLSQYKNSHRQYSFSASIMF